MTYYQTLNRLIHKELELRSDDFVRNYDPYKRSVILIPGGMGSKLVQSSAPYQSGSTYPPNPSFREIWLSWPSILNRHLVQLEMNSNAHDWQNRPIIAKGELNSIVKSYDETETFFNRNGFNYTEFGFDWRREIQVAAEFLRTFLTMIRDKVMAQGLKNPLSRLTLFAHSMGGLVAKLFINELIDSNEDTAAWFYRFVSVGTPFYGTDSHIQRYFAGDKLVNIIVGQPRVVAGMVATMPGPYILMPAPPQVLEPHYADLGLTRYPVREFDDPTIPVDPYHPNTRSRFPAFVVDDYLYNAGDTYWQIDQRVPDSTRDRVFHLRNNTKGADNLEYLWEKTTTAGSPDFTGESPVTHNGGASDGTVPYWSARLANTPDDQVYDLDTKTDHGDLAEDPNTLKIVKMLAEGRDLPQPGELPQPEPVEMVANAEIENLAREIHSGEVTETNLMLKSKPTVRAFFNRLSLGA